MKEASGAGRSDDCRKLRTGILNLIHDDSTQSLVPGIDPLSKDKISRGFVHPELGNLLRPDEYDWNDVTFVVSLWCPI